jgi:hypothetical protein
MKCGEHLLPHAFLFPFIVVIKNGVVRRKVMGKISPLTAGAEPIKNATCSKGGV